MADWCNNHIVFSGDAARVENVRALFREIQEKQDRDEKLWLPPFVTAERSYMIAINVTDETIYFRSRWVPNIDALVQIANQYGLDFVNRYDEINTGVFGEASYTGGVLSNINLDDNDLKDSHFENDRSIFGQLLEQKKSNAIYFQTTGCITKEQLNQLYGELPEGNLLLKFAEHKNFAKACEVFHAMDDRTIIEIDNFLINTHKDSPEQFTTREKFLAMSFLQQLVNEWNVKQRDRQHQTGYSR
ncbi:MAG TPA: hypothetical protein VFE53_24050 [Mucilaginibacter sp.]|jgi:hypothetical protein|nr:hypothetical protein [Mucilaginibacter sp.]